MRIIGNIDHPTLKITVFKMDNKLSVKFEAGLFEQTYKFRESSEMADFEAMQRLVDEQLVQEVLENFGRMGQSKNGAIGRYLPKEAEEFEEII
jgi:hypothetical protein